MLGSVALMHDAFGRERQTLKERTPAIVAAVTDHVWNIEDIVSLLSK